MPPEAPAPPDVGGHQAWPMRALPRRCSPQFTPTVTSSPNVLLPLRSGRPAPGSPDSCTGAQREAAASLAPAGASLTAEAGTEAQGAVRALAGAGPPGPLGRPTPGVSRTLGPASELPLLHGPRDLGCTGAGAPTTGIRAAAQGSAPRTLKVGPPVLHHLTRVPSSCLAGRLLQPLLLLKPTPPPL